MLYPAELRAPARAIAVAMCGRQARWTGLVLGLALVAGGAQAQEFRLADGRSAVAAGIVVTGPAPTVTGLAPLDPDAVVLDRHGRVRAQLRAADGAWLQAGLVARGQAIVAPAGDVAEADLTRLLRAGACRSRPEARRLVGWPARALARGAGGGAAWRVRPGAGHRRDGGAARRLHLSRFRRRLETRLHAAGGEPRPRPARARRAGRRGAGRAGGSWRGVGCSRVPGR